MKDYKSVMKVQYQVSGADTGFPVGGAPTLQGAPTYDFAKFCEKLHKIEKILGGGVRAGGVPPKSSTGCVKRFTRVNWSSKCAAEFSCSQISCRFEFSRKNSRIYILSLS